MFRDEVMKKPDGRDVLFKGRPPLTADWVSKQVRSLSEDCSIACQLLYRHTAPPQSVCLSVRTAQYL